MNRVPVQVYWDVHDWIFNSSGACQELFVFKPGLPKIMLDDDRDGGGGGDDHDNNNGSSENCSTQSGAPVPDFCILLYAWKVE